MTNTEVTRFPGVYQRTDSAVYWFALKAPADVSHHFSNQWAVRRSLKTRDLREANDKARALQAEWADKFAALRKADNPEKVTLNPALAGAVVAELRRWVLEADDNMRSYPEGPRGLLTREARHAAVQSATTTEGQRLATLLPPQVFSGLTIGPPKRPPTEHPEADPLGGLSDSEHAAVMRWNSAGAATAAIDMARRNLRGVLPLADAVAKSMGLAVDWTSPKGRAGLLECLKAYTHACSDAVRRDAGEVVHTPPPTTPDVTVQNAPQAAPASALKNDRGHTFRDAH